MKILSRSLMCAAVAFASTPATAALITKDVAYDSYAAAAQTDFLTRSFNQVTEDFDDENLGSGVSDPDGNIVEAYTGDQQSSWVRAASLFSTDVGTFELTEAESPGSNDVRENDLMIENENTGEFGRSTPGNWLDSNDALKVTWSILDGNAGSRNAIGFFLSDANDVNASLVLEFLDGTVSETIDIATDLDNGNLAYVTIISDLAFSNAIMTFNNGADTNDGWAIDEVTVANVPEPGTLALLGLGLAGLGLTRRRG